MSDDEAVTDEVLDGLLALQAAETTLRRVARKLDDLPEQQVLDDIAKRHEQLLDEQADVRVSLEQEQAEQRRLEKDLELLRTRLEDENQRMYSGAITTPKELQSQRAEIDSTERLISEHEDDLLAAMERTENLETRSNALAEAEVALEGERAAAEQARDDAARDLLAEKAESEVERDRLRGSLPAEVLDRFDVTADKRGGIAIGELVEESCTACRLELPRADLNELREGGPLATCPECRRMLVVR
ncbi:MAG: C4-type zinc ribbon domain-containing protein [Nitriliruptorales bacterium]|nr:C4-type zinc ribbon domain-containing protein [Nitriliruptorales bacterium]